MYKIGVNALYLDFGVNGGTETYFNNIVRPWYEQEQKNILVILLAKNYPPWWTSEKPWFKIKIFGIRNIVDRILTEQVIYPIFLSREVDLLFNPGYVGSRWLSCPQVNTIHDAFAWVYPKEIGFLRGIYWRYFIPSTARKAKKIIAVSNCTASDIKRYCKVANEKIEVIHEGALQLNFPESSLLLKKCDLIPKTYFHCVGFFKEIKNPFRIIEAFLAYKALEPSSRAKLVLVGHVGASGKKILDVAQKTKDVICVGRISDADLQSLYRNSLGLIFPSLYEGFGIPILEAQACGCPVVTSNLSAMPEVAGNGAIMVNPLVIGEISNAFSRLEFDDVNDVIDSGYENVARFSWQRASEETMAVIRATLE